MTRSAASSRPSRPEAAVLTPSQLALLAAVQDRLIPPEGDPSASSGQALPGAGESGAAQRVDGYLAERPEWRPDLLAALQAIDVAAQQVLQARAAPAADLESTGFLGLSGNERDAVLRTLEAAQPRLFRWLLHLTYAAYYTDAGVQRAGGYAAEPPLPRGYSLPTFDESRLEPIRRRGKLWRDA